MFAVSLRDTLAPAREPQRNGGAARIMGLSVYQVGAVWGGARVLGHPRRRRSTHRPRQTGQPKGWRAAC
jgi:hypothetical protein